MNRQPYVVRIYAGVHEQYLSLASDEDDAVVLPRTADIVQAVTFDKFSDARRAALEAAKAYPDHQFKVFPAPLHDGGGS